MLQDIRFALRALTRSPAFSGVAVLTLSLGIAAAAAIFSLFYQVLLRSLPVPQPDRLVVLHASGPTLPGGHSEGTPGYIFSYPMYRRLRDGAGLFQGLAARSESTVQALLSGGAERVEAELVTGTYFSVLGLKPALGRMIAPDDDQTGHANPVAVLAFRYWVKNYGAGPDVLNRKILLNGNPFLVVGVAPEGYDGFVPGRPFDLFLPLSIGPLLSPGWEDFENPGTQWLNVIGRLKLGASREQAEASLRPAWSAALRDHIKQVGVGGDKIERQTLLSKNLTLLSAAGGIRNLEVRWRKPLTALLVMVGLLLLIACANVANLLTARGLARGREIAIRVALGAARWELVRQTLVESLLIALAGGLLGTALSFALLRGLIAFLPQGGTRQFLTARPDLTVLGFSLLMVLSTALLFGILPALQSSRVDPMHALKEQISSGSGSQSRWRQALVAAQLALSLALLGGAGFFAETLIKLLHHDSGLRPDHLVMFTVDPRLSGYSVDRGQNFYRDLRHRLEQLPQVHSVSLAEVSPLTRSEWSSNVTVEGFHARTMQDAISDANAVGPGFFRTVGTPLLRGREFDERDREGAAKVAIVNQTFAKLFLHGRDPLEKRMTIGSGHPLDMVIVGEVKDSQNLDLRDAPKATFYQPFEQAYHGDKELPAHFFVRSAGDPQTLEGGIRRIVRQLDPNVPAYIKTMNEVVNSSVFTDRLSALLALVFGVLAILLAAIGLYGVIAYSVTRRTMEIGIRLALGAVPRQVLVLVMREVMTVAAWGVLAGVPLAYAFVRLMSSQLYGMKAYDPAMYCGAVAVIACAAVAAGLLPAWRAAAVDPKNALRYE